MPWTDITRIEHNRSYLRYPSDLTDAEWHVVSRFVAPPRLGGLHYSDHRRVAPSQSDRLGVRMPGLWLKKNHRPPHRTGARCHLPGLRQAGDAGLEYIYFSS